MPRLALALVMLAALPSAASAQVIASVDEFRPALDARGYLTLNGSQTLGHGEMSFGLGSLEWGHRVLGTTSNDNVVSATLVGALGLHLGALPLQLGVSVPFTIVDGASRADQQGVGDVGLHLKARVARLGRVGVGAIASVYLPSETSQVTAVADASLGRVRLSLNAGVRVHHDTMMMDMTTSAAVRGGAGLAYALAPERIELVGEVFGSPSSLEALGGLKVYLAKSSYMVLGAGRGLMTSEPGNPDFRAVIGIVFEPRPAARMSVRVPDEIVAAVPPVDRTDDGHGDRDNDGIFDRDDKCPDDMEDYDAVEDEDGCPEVDDTPRDLVIEQQSELVTLRPIEFELDKAVLRPSAYPILDAVVKALRDNPGITLVEVQGHTDEQGRDDYNLDLSTRRAVTVRTYLVERGIAASRLTSQGYGETDPVDPRHTQAAYAINRRVAFMIQEREH